MDRGTILIRGTKVDKSDLEFLIVELHTFANLATFFGCSISTIKKIVRIAFPDIEISTAPIGLRVGKTLNLKRCYKCKVVYTLNNFHKNTRECKSCTKLRNAKREKLLPNKTNLAEHRAYQNARHAAKLKRTPRWANLEEIGEFYKNCPEGYHVDHIVPLRGEKVSGFHILENLQYLTAEENLRKGNKFDG